MAVKFTLTFPDPENEPLITASMTIQDLDTIVRQPILTSMETGHMNRDEAIDTATIMLGHDPAEERHRRDAEAYLFERPDELSDYFNGFY